MKRGDCGFEKRGLWFKKIKIVFRMIGCGLGEQNGTKFGKKSRWAALIVFLIQLEREREGVER